MQTMVLNDAQREVLNVMSCLKRDEDIYELKRTLVNFLNDCLQRELDSLWNNGMLSEEKLESYRNEHNRTKYQ